MHLHGGYVFLAYEFQEAERKRKAEIAKKTTEALECAFDGELDKVFAPYASCFAGRPCGCAIAALDSVQVRAILSTDSAIGVDAADANGNTLLSEAAVGGQAQARVALHTRGQLTAACNRFQQSG